MTPPRTQQQNLIGRMVALHRDLAVLATEIDETLALPLATIGALQSAASEVRTAVIEAVGVDAGGEG